MKTVGLDTSPRRIWDGLTIPGKKMMAILSPRPGVSRGRGLIELYGNDAYMALWAAAVVIHKLSSSEAPLKGPALRDTFKRVDVSNPHGAILTDLRDFLKLRFRARGQEDVDAITARMGKDPDGASGELLISMEINGVIADLDALSRLGFSEGVRSHGRFISLRDRLRSLARRLYPGEIDIFDKYIDALAR